jgi:hypothetical protein
VWFLSVAPIWSKSKKRTARALKSACEWDHVIVWKKGRLKEKIFHFFRVPIFCGLCFFSVCVSKKIQSIVINYNDNSMA